MPAAAKMSFRYSIVSPLSLIQTFHTSWEHLPEA